MNTGSQVIQTNLMITLIAGADEQHYPLHRLFQGLKLLVSGIISVAFERRLEGSNGLHHNGDFLNLSCDGIIR